MVRYRVGKKILPTLRPDASQDGAAGNSRDQRHWTAWPPALMVTRSLTQDSKLWLLPGYFVPTAAILHCVEATRNTIQVKAYKIII